MTGGGWRGEKRRKGKNSICPKIKCPGRQDVPIIEHARSGARKLKSGKLSTSTFKKIRHWKQADGSRRQGFDLLDLPTRGKEGSGQKNVPYGPAELVKRKTHSSGLIRRAGTREL